MTVRIVDVPAHSREAICDRCKTPLLYDAADVKRVEWARIGDEPAFKLDPPGHAITCASCGRAVVVGEWSR